MCSHPTTALILQWTHGQAASAWMMERGNRSVGRLRGNAIGPPAVQGLLFALQPAKPGTPRPPLPVSWLDSNSLWEWHGMLGKFSFVLQEAVWKAALDGRLP